MPRVLVIDAWMPTPDRDAASVRMVHLLKILRDLSANVTFAGDHFSPQRPSVRQLQDDGIRVISTSIEEHLEQAGETYDLIILSRLPVASKYIESVRQFAPRASIVFDTTDLHFLRGFRGAKVTGNISLLKQALEAKREELAIAREADCTLVVSPVEKTILEKESPGLKVHILSLIHPVIGAAAPFSEREGILFIGAFPHHPNVDAMDYFCREVHPLLKQKLAGIKTFIIGTDPPAWLRELNSAELVITDYVADVEPCFRRCKLSIAPLRYGAGVKGKVLLSMSYGVPVVASSVAAEGIPVVAGRDMLIADDPNAFSDRITELYRDQSLWDQLSNNGLGILSEHFSFDAARRSLMELYAMLGLTPQDRQSSAVRK